MSRAASGPLHRVKADRLGVGAERSTTVCDLDVFTDQATEAVQAQKPDVGVRSGWMKIPGGRALFVPILDQELEVVHASSRFSSRLQASCA